MFLDELFKHECDHSSEMTYVEDLKFKVPFEKRKLGLRIFTFDKPTNDQTFENIIKSLELTKVLKNHFQEELMFG